MQSETFFQKTYNLLYEMFGAYFHQDWLHVDYDFPEGENPHFKTIVHEYLKDCDDEDVNLVIKQLEELVLFNWSERKYRNILVYHFGNCINPHAFGLTYREYLQEIIGILKQDSRYKPQV